MSTERPNARFADIDLWEPADALEAMIGGQFAAVAAVRAALPALERAAMAIEDRLRAGGRLIYAGAGTSGRLAVQDGAELMPTFGWEPDRLVLLIAGGERALVRAIENAEDTTEQVNALMQQHQVDAGDAVVAVAASGTTPFTLQCLRQANILGALSVGIANNDATPLLCEAIHPILLESGAEPIAGSTRMNAGTAQRIALTLISTLVMIRLGRVYRGLMIDVQATNSKLTRRKQEMLAYLSGKSETEAQAALVRAGGNLKLALLLLHGCSLDAGRDLLQRTDGQLRAAIKLVKS
jgi:N-acetylmuramic acid 6-phosphate etherase